MAVAVGVRLVLPPAEATVPVVVTAHALEAGSAVGSDDVRIVRVPARATPEQAPAAPEDVVGQRTAIDLPSGIALVPSLLTSGRFGAEPPAGTVVVPIDLEGAGALRPGDTVELVQAAECPVAPEAWSVSALVLGPALRPDTDTDTAGSVLGLGTGAAAGALADLGSGMTLIAVPPESGRKIVRIAQNCPFGAAIVP